MQAEPEREQSFGRPFNLQRQQQGFDSRQICSCPSPNILLFPSQILHEMLSSLLASPAPAALHLPPIKSLATPSFLQRPASKNPILVFRIASNARLGPRSTLSGNQGDMPESAGFAALGGGQGLQEDGGKREAEATLCKGPSNSGRRFAWCDVESFLNRMSKWVVVGFFGLVILLKHDAEVLWAAMGSVLNTGLSISLKRILNHERPVFGLRSDPGMPSSHAQSIFYSEAFAILWMFHWQGLNLSTVTVGIGTLMFGLYLTWLRVSQRLHTMSQVLVGALLGSTCGIAWFWLWNSIVLEAFISSEWVRITVILSSATFCTAFMVYGIHRCLQDEP